MHSHVGSSLCRHWGVTEAKRSVYVIKQVIAAGCLSAAGKLLMGQ